MSVTDDKRPGATAPASLYSLDDNNNNNNFAEFVLLFFILICRRLFCSHSKNMLIIVALLDSFVNPLDGLLSS